MTERERELYERDRRMSQKDTENENCTDKETEVFVYDRERERELQDRDRRMRQKETENEN